MTEEELTRLKRTRPVSAALLAWHALEKSAGTKPADLAVAFNLMLGHAVAGFVATNQPAGLAPEECVQFHVDEIRSLALKALEQAEEEGPPQ